MITTDNQAASQPERLKVFMLGATGTAGRATACELVRAGHSVTCFVRPDQATNNLKDIQTPTDYPAGVSVRFGDVTDVDSLRNEGFNSEQFDVMVSCLASRTGSPADAWAIDHQAHVQALTVAKEAKVQHMVLLSAICVQKPMLAFQHAKLAFERELMDSGLTYSIVRPTAFFKSLSGQVDRVRRGKPFLTFGDGTLTACKPISDNDLGRFIVSCLDDKTRHNKILPIGGPGPAATPREQGEWLFEMTGQTPKFRQLPIAVLDSIQKVLQCAGYLIPACARKAELARIGRYYATESMLVLNPVTGLYDADATPSFGTDTLRDFYANLLDGSTTIDRGDHAVFRSKN